MVIKKHEGNISLKEPTMNDKTTQLSSLSESNLHDIKDILHRKMEVIRKSGEMRGLSLVKKYATITEILAFKAIKESGNYKGLPYKDANGDIKYTTGLKDFCPPFLGYSYKTLQESLANLEALGQAFIESAQAMGLGYRQIKQLRQLPGEDQTLIIESEAIDSGDKEAVKDLIDELNAKHKKETDDIKRDLKEAKQLAEARDSVIKSNHIDKQNLAEELATIKQQQKNDPQAWLKTIKEMNLLSTRIAGQILEGIDQLAELTDRILLTEQDGEHSELAYEHMATVHINSADQVWLAANTLSLDTRERFAFYVEKARPMYSEEEMIALEQEIISRG